MFFAVSPRPGEMKDVNIFKFQRKGNASVSIWPELPLQPMGSMATLSPDKVFSLNSSTPDLIYVARTVADTQKYARWRSVALCVPSDPGKPKTDLEVIFAGYRGKMDKLVHFDTVTKKVFTTRRKGLETGCEFTLSQTASGLESSNLTLPS